jgi:hypothetical protein
MITVDQVRTLDVQLAIWTGRDHDNVTPLERVAADAVIEICDEILQAVYLVRGHTVSERRECDDLRATRLAALRGPEVPPHVMKIIDKVLPRTQVNDRWAETREQYRQ